MPQAKPRIKFSVKVIMKAPYLLPMRYKVSELCEELGVPDRTLRGWLEMGIPVVRDDSRHIWVHGQEFADWVNEIHTKPPKTKMKDNEAYCLKCRDRVTLIDPQTIPLQGKLVNFRGECPQCNSVINRGGVRVS